MQFNVVSLRFPITICRSELARDCWILVNTECSAHFDPPSGLPVFNALPAHKPDGTGRPELAINLRVPAFEALLAEIDVMLLAFIRRVDFGMTGTFAHGQPLSNR